METLAICVRLPVGKPLIRDCGSETVVCEPSKMFKPPLLPNLQ